MKPFDFLVLSLAVFRMGRMITGEAGPFKMFALLRKFVRRNAPKETHMDEGITCFWCMSVQIAFVIAITERFFFHSNAIYDIIIYGLALSGFAVIINTINQKLT